MTPSARAISVKPIWIGAGIGAAVGMFDPALGVVVTTTLGFVAGYLVYAHDHGRTQQKDLNARIGDLLERVSLLEYSVKRLRSADVVADAPTDVPADEAADSAASVAEPFQAKAALFDVSPSAPPAVRPAARAVGTAATLRVSVDPVAAPLPPTPPPAATVASAQPAARAGRPWVSKPSP